MLFKRKRAQSFVSAEPDFLDLTGGLSTPNCSSSDSELLARNLGCLPVSASQALLRDTRAFHVASDSDTASDSTDVSQEVASSPVERPGSHFNVSLSTSTLYNRAWAKFVSFDRRLAGRTITEKPLPVISIGFSVFSNNKSLFRLARTPLILPQTVRDIEELLTSFVVDRDKDKEKGRDKRAQRVNEIFASRPNFDETQFNFADLVALFERGVPDATFLVKHPRLELQMRPNMAIVDFWRLWSQEPDFPQRSSEDWHADPLRIIMNPSEAERNLKLFSKPSAINKKKA